MRQLIFEDLELDPVRFRASRAGRELKLGSRAFAILELLMRHAGETLSRSQIVSAVWGPCYTGSAGAVDSQIRLLRAQVDDPFPRTLIQTVRGEGYRMLPQRRKL